MSEEMEFHKKREEFRKLRKKRSAECKLQMTSMIDIVFLLIIFLIVVTDLSQTEIEEVELPFAVEGTPDDESKRVVVNVTEKGRVRMWGRTYDEAGFLAHITERARRSGLSDGLPRLLVKIRADARAEYRHVQRVMIQCIRARIWRISFATRPAEEESFHVEF